jgi:hypothetical protein
MDKDEVFYPHRGSPYDPSLWDDILLWFPGIAWFYYLLNGYAPRTINHFNPVNKYKFFREKKQTLFILFKFEPLFYNRHRVGVCSSLAAYLGMVYFLNNRVF